MKSPAMKDTVKMMAYFEKAPKVSEPYGADQILGAPSMTMSEWLKT